MPGHYWPVNRQDKLIKNERAVRVGMKAVRGIRKGPLATGLAYQGMAPWQGPDPGAVPHPWGLRASIKFTRARATDCHWPKPKISEVSIRGSVYVLGVKHQTVRRLSVLTGFLS